MASFMDQSYTYKPYRPENPMRKKLLGLLKIIILWFVVLQIISVFFISTVRMENESMLPALQKGDKLLVSPLLYGPEIMIVGAKLPFVISPKRGDIVLSSLPRRPDYPFFFRIADPVLRFFTGGRIRSFSRSLRASQYTVTVKRLIGLPGDAIRIENNTVFIKPSSEPYFIRESELIQKQYDVYSEPPVEGYREDLPFSGTVKEFILKEDEYFLLGDNRSASSDSTYWGPVSSGDLKAKVLLRYWPIKRFHGL